MAVNVCVGQQCRIYVRLDAQRLRCFALMREPSARMSPIVSLSAPALNEWTANNVESIDLALIRLQNLCHTAFNKYGIVVAGGISMGMTETSYNAT